MGRLGPALAATVIVASAALPAAYARQSDRGEEILNASCQNCHDLRRIHVSAKDAAEWTKTVNLMIEKGAKVARNDLPVLVDYLARNFSDQ